MSWEYDTSHTNPYIKRSLGTIMGEQSDTKEPEYAAPDEMSVFNNKAYGTNRTFVPPAENIYSAPEAPNLRQKHAEIGQTMLHHGEATRQRVLCSIICALVLFISFSLASIALIMVLLPSTITTTPQSCNCTQTVDSLNMLASFEERLNETSSRLKESQRETRMLASLVAELSENTSSLLAPLVPPMDEVTGSLSINVTKVPHKCTTQVETRCRVQRGQRQCQTPCIHETVAGSVAINFQCIREESAEPNPLIGILDITGGEALCLCYLVQFNSNNPQATHPVDCALRVTRCQLADLQA